ncbi:MAG: TetR family transcriptional regulator [Gammaproteobacteria bacterium]|nr:TetR family transcriptional regulator [Gammaproteobacteria bacterium]
MPAPTPATVSTASPVSSPAKIPLRERKYYQTRIRLARALREQLEQVSLDDLNVRDLCDVVEVSEATFFNYFPKKSDLLAYLSQLWSVELAWHGQQALAAPSSGGSPGAGSGLGVVQAVFERAAQQFQIAPGAAGELIAWQARTRQRQAPAQLDVSERRLAFPEQPGIETMTDQSLEQVLATALQRAIDQGELPRNIHLPTTMVALVSVFYGVPLALRLSNPAGIGAMYRQQLMILWTGLRQVAAARG